MVINGEHTACTLDFIFLTPPSPAMSILWISEDFSNIPVIDIKISQITMLPGNKHQFHRVFMVRV